MIDLWYAAILASKQANLPPNPEYVDRYCAALVGIPYASDNFDNSKWQSFVTCREVMGSPATDKKN